MILPVSFYSRSTLKVLEDLIGKVLVRKSEEGLTSGVIVEAEAYTGEDDPASYAFSGRTKRSEIMYGPPGRAFVHFTYGMHHMLNLVTEREEFPAAILIRALEPREGISLMKKRRQTEELINLCSGPAKICQAFCIDRSHNGVSLFSLRSLLFIKEGERREEEERREKRKEELIWTSRIGIREGKERLWRAYLKGSPFISVK
ncbi:DNA-3-methyladenine glycosylase [Candidatus Aerophobetes bacterium]|uniref:Putative 3-methyladenine DNA glycosylase n=1 Tax=Aerophobetes bacterium TaxID=2030807 RepID=A0A523Y2F1_UNCAE|nr:MAG: DNA-3-methyladenine glycosylase [Candidatus Aerophobetes bacterium]